MRWPDKYVIGLTGNIAVGKSVVRHMLQHLGAYTIDADSLGHQVLMPGAPAYKPVIDSFGTYIVGSDGHIDRSKLANIVFSDPEALRILENITHPIIRQAIDALAQQAPKKVVVIEAVKLLESPWVKDVNSVWVVNANTQTQVRRLMEDRGMSAEEAKQRVYAQNSQVSKLEQADIIINNGGSVESTWKQVQTHWNDIQQMLQAQEEFMPS